MPGSSQKRREHLHRLMAFQKGRCYWCHIAMLPPGSHKPKKGVTPDHRLCTRDHLDDRYSEERGKHPGEYRIVAACWKCNHDRGVQRTKALELRELHRRSRRFRELTDA